ncbi:MAG: hypothetical protein R3E13_07930 [Alphaproteobacteria bacterium]
MNMTAMNIRLRSAKDLYSDALFARADLIREQGLNATVQKETKSLQGHGFFDGFAGLCNASKTNLYSEKKLATLFNTLATSSGVIALNTFSPVAASSTNDLHEQQDNLIIEPKHRMLGAGRFEMTAVTIDAENFRYHIPLLGFDDDILETSALHPDAPLIHSLSALMSASNHDYIHQLTDPSSYVGHKKKPLLQWREERLLGGDSVHSYENWHILAHAKILQTYREASGFDRVEVLAQSFLNELEGYSRDIAKSGLSAQKQHDVVDYFGLVGAQALMAVMPLDDPRLTSYLERLEKIDPQPNRVWDDIKRLEFLNLAPEASQEATRNAINKITPSDKDLNAALSHYKEIGNAVQTRENGDLGYLNLKRLQLAASNPKTAHVHSPDIPSALEKVFSLKTDLSKANKAVELSLRPLVDTLYTIRNLPA